MLNLIPKNSSQRITFLSIFFFILFFNLTGVILPSLAQSSDFEEVSGIYTTANVAGFATGANAESVDSIIAMIIYIVLGLVGTIFLGLIIYSGVRWMIAQGNEEKINKAKESLLNAVVGLIITLGAYALSYFIIGYFT